jgi:periplasmic divalent cation tolerance protein
MTEYILVFVTAPSAEEANVLATALVEQRLVACANIVPNIRSVFWWKEAIETEQEVLVMFKSTSALFPAIVEAVKSLHRYEVPEIIAMPIVLGSEDYLAWISAETQSFPA